MQQGMYPGMDGPQGPTPVPVGVNRGGQGTPNPNVYNRGRGMGQGMGLRGRGSYTGRGRGNISHSFFWSICTDHPPDGLGMPAPPVRPASPLPPNVPTGPRNQNKYKDRDNNGPAVDGLDYGGGAGGQDRGGSTPVGDYEERSSSRYAHPFIVSVHGSFIDRLHVHSGNDGTARPLTRDETQSGDECLQVLDRRWCYVYIIDFHTSIPMCNGMEILARSRTSGVTTRNRGVIQRVQYITLEI